MEVRGRRAPVPVDLVVIVQIQLLCQGGGGRGGVPRPPRHPEFFDPLGTKISGAAPASICIEHLPHYQQPSSVQECR